MDDAEKPLLAEEFAGILGPPPGGKTLMEYIDEIDREPMVRSMYKLQQNADGDDEASVEEDRD